VTTQLQLIIIIIIIITAAVKHKRNTGRPGRRWEGKFIGIINTYGVMV
jgi:hypothetical protein